MFLEIRESLFHIEFSRKLLYIWFSVKHCTCYSMFCCCTCIWNCIHTCCLQTSAIVSSCCLSFCFFPCCLGVPVWLVLQLPLMPWSYYMYKVFQVLSQVCLSATPWLYFPFLAAGSICIFPYTADNQKQYHTTTSCSAFSSLRRRFGEVLG